SRRRAQGDAILGVAFEPRLPERSQWRRPLFLDGAGRFVHHGARLFGSRPWLGRHGAGLRDGEHDEQERHERPPCYATMPAVKRLLARRTAAMLPTLFGITFLAFAVVRAAPGDALTLQAELGLRPGGATLQQIGEYRRLMGLDEPLLAGYLRWLTQLLRGDLGYSFRDGRPVTTLLAEALPVTLLLSLPSLLLGYLLAIPIGIASAARPGGLLDRALSSLVFLLYSLPLQWVALALVVWPAGLPIQGLHSEGTRSLSDLAAHLALP